MGVHNRTGVGGGGLFGWVSVASGVMLADVSTAFEMLMAGVPVAAHLKPPCHFPGGPVTEPPEGAP